MSFVSDNVVGNPLIDPLGDPFQLTGGPKKEPGGKKGGAAPNPSADALAEISKGLYTEATPLRHALMQRSNDFINGGADVTATPQYAALKAGNDSQFNRAKDNTIASTASGGALTDALSNLETNRAVNMTQGMGGIADNEMSRAFALATGSTPTSLNGLGSAANAQSQLIAANQEAQAKSAAGAGTAAGSIIASIIAK